MLSLPNLSKKSSISEEDPTQQGLQPADSAIALSSPQGLPQGSPQKNAFSPQQLSPNQQRAYAKARKARKAAQREQAAAMPPKPKLFIITESQSKALMRRYGLIAIYGAGQIVLGVTPECAVIFDSKTLEPAVYGGLEGLLEAIDAVGFDTSITLALVLATVERLGLTSAPESEAAS